MDSIEKTLDIIQSSEVQNPGLDVKTKSSHQKETKKKTSKAQKEDKVRQLWEVVFYLLR